MYQKRKDHINHYNTSHFSQVAVSKECYQLEQPPGGSNNDCRFDEFCACDFYELSGKGHISESTINSPMLHVNDTYGGLTTQKQTYKTYCRVGEKGICLHVCHLTILKPGSCKDANLILFTLCCIMFDIFGPFILY